ncbi:MAG: LamG domain-containing protein [Planctomycetes bacterium]|nr:LamG domain-containing protein [Planctomycetota bacterium]
MLRRMMYIVLVMMLGLVPMNMVYGYEHGSPDLLAWWTFDEGAGDIVGDASGNGNDGILVDGPTVVDGQFGQALAFDDSCVAIGASDSLTADLFQGSFTLAAWINPTRSGYKWQQIFRSIRADDNPNDTLFINNDGRLSWRGRIGGAWAGGMCETAPDVVPTDQWTHVAVTGDGRNFRIYVNGALSQESAFQTTEGTNATYYIGGSIWAAEYYIGMIDDVRIYNMALTGLEILVAMEGVEQVDIAAPGDIV